MAIEGIIVNGVSEILNKLVQVVAQEVGLAWGVKDELQKLQKTLEMILAVIADAERKQVNDAAVNLWLRRLKDVAYEAEDVMDEFSYETMHRCERRESLKYKVCDFFSSSNPLAFHFKMAKKIKDVNRSLDEITKDMGRFQLQITKDHSEVSKTRSRQTASFVVESDIVGREDDKNNIIKLLTSSTSFEANRERVSAVSVVGMGGLGKTTLAQLVYTDELVIKHFEERIWVCVSDDFVVENLLVKIIESITQNKFDNMSNFDVLVNKVRQRLSERRYLLVLDDLWNEDQEQWDRLKSVLVVGAEGSKILITTRKNQVADVVRGGTPPYKLGKLQDVECWSIIQKRAFSPGGALETPNMKSIGQEIAHKCSGLPLAANFLGSLMHSRDKEGDWLLIKENDVWDTPESQSKLIPILKLSYDNLSSQLKQCFSYCSIFPKDWEMNKQTLIQLWIAEGFLSISNIGNGRSIEDVGEECFEGLVWSSFFEGVQKNLLDDIITCKMHDLVHDLAQAVVGGNECAIVKASELKNVSEVRRVQLIFDDELSATFPETLSSLKKLRTVIILKPNTCLAPSRFSSNKHLRVLYFGNLGVDFSKLPYASARLNHLRYLHLSSFDLSEVTNDKSIHKFYNLQTLVLTNCSHVQNLLRNIGFSKNLRHLDLSFTDTRELPDSVTSLCNLQWLDLNHCNSLTAIPNSVTGLKCLRYLDMSFTPIEYLPDFITSLRNLQTLDVNSCSNLKALPEYVSGLDNLRIFNFKNCPLLEALPKDFGALTHLRYLNLNGTEIKVLPESCANLRNLEFVHLFWCDLPKELKNWTKLRKFFHFKKGTPMGLEKLVLLQGLSYKVPEIVIDNAECNNGIEGLGNLNFLEELYINHLQNVKDPVDAERANLRGKQNLCVLQLRWDEEMLGVSWDQNSCSFRVIEALQPNTSLRKLNVLNFMGCELPSWMCVSSFLPKLEQLELDNCIVIKHLPAAIGQLQRLRYLTLKRMSLKSLDIVGFPSLLHLCLIDMFLLKELCYSHPFLQNLNINGCRSLSEIPSFPSLKQLKLEKIDHKLLNSIGRCQTSLTSLFLENVEELIFFPGCILENNCYLQTLVFKECNQFQGFRINANQNENKVALLGPELHNSSLQTLVLVGCPVLTSLPDLRGWTSLGKLLIFHCPQIKGSSTYDLKSLSSLKELYVDFLQRDERQGEASDVEELVNLMHQ